MQDGPGIDKLDRVQGQSAFRSQIGDIVELRNGPMLGDDADIPPPLAVTAAASGAAQGVAEIDTGNGAGDQHIETAVFPGVEVVIEIQGIFSFQADTAGGDGRLQIDTLTDDLDAVFQFDSIAAIRTDHQIIVVIDEADIAEGTQVEEGIAILQGGGGEHQVGIRDNRCPFVVELVGGVGIGAFGILIHKHRR
ncbi:hypothetical protein DSCO28_34520 [Desulfosarcina ovata subsp. sediminis]|uniref:Uncharacterized protein n=1 Tax=Desulfosarcina ovata subsp. sediminis TaxID=885957 RepID=A0A5K7ZNF3_9BACT|nr:hypothetical protein DSCO28_34520 [Desulfosarcina ovata subsp. sediminis]